MKKEVAPELYNYNKYPGPAFALVGDKVVSENIELQLLTNYKDAFDQTVFGQRFSQLMLKFDYIVGDWGNDQLRLKGFYKDEREVADSNKISRLDDYLTEYCNFGCAYFVLENPAPVELAPELEDKPRRRRNRSRNNQKQGLDRKNRDFGKKYQEKEKSRSAFKKRQKKEPRDQKAPTKQSRRREENKGNRSFVIRQKEGR